MVKVVLLSLLVVLSACSITPAAHAKYYSRSVAYEPPKLQKTHLRLFVHDILSGDKPSAIQIAGPTNKDNPSPFGSTFAIDDILTVGPEPTSQVVGNARGMWVSSSQDKNLSLVMMVDLAFTTGEFKGSSISVFSRNEVTEERRELAVVGGRGRFRLAKGSVWVRTHYLNTTNGDAVLEYSAEVIHP